MLLSQVQNLTLRSQKLGVLSSSQNGPPKSSSQTQSLCPSKAGSSSKGSSDPSESNRKGESPAPESRSTPVTRTSSIHHLITPGGISVECGKPGFCQSSVFSDRVIVGIPHEQSSDFISKFTYLLVLDVAQDFD